jgi:DNA-binding LytR/AlgR family response regulator
LENHNETLRKLLRVIGEFPEFQWVESSCDYEEGMNTILKHAPEVVFVDVDTSVKEYPDVYAYCKEINEHLDRKPLYIAISHDKCKAYEAIKNKFFDYLLKPGKELDIRKIILQVLKQKELFSNDVICLKSYKDFTLLNVHDILYLQADNNSTDFILIGNHKTSAYKTLKFFETTLPGNFLRIHNSYIINRNHISRVNFGKCKCYLDNNKIVVPFSKSYRHNLQPLRTLLADKAIAL